MSAAAGRRALAALLGALAVAGYAPLAVFPLPLLALAALMLLWRHTAASCPNATHLSSNRTIVFSPRSLFSVRSAHLFEISVVFNCQI